MPVHFLLLLKPIGPHQLLAADCGRYALAAVRLRKFSGCKDGSGNAAGVPVLYNNICMFRGNLATKAVIKNSVLSGSRGNSLQTVAVVYIDAQEYRVLAPSEATGDALEWANHFVVHTRADDGFGDVEADNAMGILAFKLAREELEERKRNANRVDGLNPDGAYHNAHICHNGHVHSSFGDIPKTQYCDKCGEPIIADCMHCKTPIRGQFAKAPSHYIAPHFCHNCGKPYPWMEERLKTAHALLDNDDKLTLEDRKELWGLLNYVMSSPKADMVPAKRKLIEIKLGNAAQATKDLVLEFMAKVTVESLKG